MSQRSEPASLADRMHAARNGLEQLLAAKPDAVSTAPEAGFRHWGDTPQWYDWHKR